ncbi:hypothetical protein [uncultured Tenacibaculum sp.]|uniref:hypothetical protein n=1 Tax=uncultured Tenacibaculum sp. TaxID=174713 RepID=UPI00261607D4|nr:hypothetical protein [uncultured Tenacibaculum sp.]
MKKQQKTYLLLALVIIVWSIVIFQFFGYVNENEQVLPEVNYANFKPNKFTKKESYKVSVHNRDPFLGTYRVVKKATPKNKKVRKKEPIIFPQIKYKGIIVNGNSKSFIVAIDGRQKIMKLGVKTNDVKLVSGSKKEIKILYKGSYKTIKK